MIQGLSQPKVKIGTASYHQQREQQRRNYTHHRRGVCHIGESSAQSFPKPEVVLQTSASSPPNFSYLPLRVMYPLNCRNLDLVMFNNDYPRAPCPGGWNHSHNWQRTIVRQRSTSTPLTVHKQIPALHPCFPESGSYGMLLGLATNIEWYDSRPAWGAEFIWTRNWFFISQTFFNFLERKLHCMLGLRCNFLAFNHSIWILTNSFMQFSFS
jgi:hypothetical protein